jgi:ergothioneine biosynthesis protein EgtB
MIKQESQTLIAIRSNFLDVRKLSQKIVSPLELEDFGIQAIEDVSPVKWHLAHTSWFFEAFVLIPYDSSYQVFHPKYDYLFNSYYVTHGEPFERSSRGNLSRPTVHEVMEYRHYIDEQITRLLDHASDRVLDEILPIIEVGIHHEQQHQELMLTDIKYNFSVNPMRPVYQMKPIPVLSEAPERKWVDVAEGLTHIGHQGDDFSYDNEQPRHKVWLDKYQISSRPVTNGEYIEFIEDEGYQTAEHWLSEGWSIVEDKQWKAPLYWKKVNGVWHHYTLSGFEMINLNEPVCHVSYYEADAFASWAGKRLPTEEEWEHVFSSNEIKGNFIEAGNHHPNSDYHANHNGLSKGFGDVWEWTMSPYKPYPGNKPFKGVLGEYNAKFMCNQMVLRGGSCATSASHIRPTYRNFFHPDKRWQFSGFRLAGDRA